MKLLCPGRTAALAAAALACSLARGPGAAQTAPASLADSACAASANTVPAITGSQLRGGELKIVAGVDAVEGHGELSAYALDDTSGSFKPGPVWKAHEQMNAAAAGRAVITNKGPAGVRLRARAATLGAILNSSPTIEGPPRAGYFGAAFAGYGEFATAWAQRRPIVWVGAADGMLHAFDADSGKPLLSYLPEALFARWTELASGGAPRLQPMVDGTPSMADVRTAAGWASFVFAPLGRGAKAIVALDATDPAALADETRADKVFRWQFTAKDDADLGHIVAEPTTSPFSRQAGQVAPMNNGRFALLAGNGVASASGNAVLYILFADGPADSGDWSGRFVKLVAETGPGNGLSQPVWVDENNDGVADSIYAGDMKGRLWKFDVRGSDPSNWKLAYGGRPLFIAKDGGGRTLPITGAPAFRFHPQGGVMLALATGDISALREPANDGRVNALFGIWDKPAFARMPTAEVEAALPRDIATQLELRSLVEPSDGNGAMIVGEAIDWGRTLGWMLPLPAARETPVGNLQPASGGQVVQVTASTASSKAAVGREVCTAWTTARLIAVDPLSGLPADGLLGSVPAKVVGAAPQSIGAIRVASPRLRVVRDLIGKGPDRAARKCSDGSHACSRIVGDEVDKLLLVPVTRSRLFWHELPGLRTRD